MHHGDGLDTALRLGKLLLDLLRFRFAGLQPEQRGNRLKVVLDPVMDFRNRGVLGLQLNIPATQFSHIPAQDDGTDTPIGVIQRHRSHRHGGTVRFELRIRCRLAAEHERQAFRERVVGVQQLCADLAEILALHGGQRSQSAEAAHRVRRGVPHDAVDREDDEPVGDAGVVPLVHHRIMIWELAAGNHLVQLLAGVDAFRFIPAVGFTSGHVGFTHHKTQGFAVMPDRRVHVAYRRTADAAHDGRAEDRGRVHSCLEFA